MDIKKFCNIIFLSQFIVSIAAGDVGTAFAAKEQHKSKRVVVIEHFDSIT